MTSARPPAPLYVDAFALCEWLLGRFGDDPRVLASSLCRGGLTLLDAVTLALKGRRRDEQVDLADEQLVTLRTQLRLAAATGYMTDAQMLQALERADSIGRQLGGWRRALGPV